MQVFGIVGPDDGVAALAETVRDVLEDRGRVALVEAGEAGRHRPDGAAEVHRLGDGEWVAEARGRDVGDVLDDLAPRVDYALLRGFPRAAVPTVALGDAEPDGEVLLSAADADAVDVAALVDRLEDAHPYETLESLFAEVKRSTEAEFAGAIATFTGRVREREGPDDERTEHLEFEKYDGVAEQTMAEIREDLEAREGVYDVRLYHKTGVVEAGEDIVHVVVLAGHRAEAFAAVEDGINELKAEVPLFKKEVTEQREYWAHERDEPAAPDER